MTANESDHTYLKWSDIAKRFEVDGNIVSYERQRENTVTVSSGSTYTEQHLLAIAQAGNLYYDNIRSDKLRDIYQRYADNFDILLTRGEKGFRNEVNTWEQNCLRMIESFIREAVKCGTRYTTGDVVIAMHPDDILDFETYLAASNESRITGPATIIWRGLTFTSNDALYRHQVICAIPNNPVQQSAPVTTPLNANSVSPQERQTLYSKLIDEELQKVVNEHVPPDLLPPGCQVYEDFPTVTKDFLENLVGMVAMQMAEAIALDALSRAHERVRLSGADIDPVFRYVRSEIAKDTAKIFQDRKW